MGNLLSMFFPGKPELAEPKEAVAEPSKQFTPEVAEPSKQSTPEVAEAKESVADQQVKITILDYS